MYYNVFFDFLGPYAIFILKNIYIFVIYLIILKYIVSLFLTPVFAHMAEKGSHFESLLSANFTHPANSVPSESRGSPRYSSSYPDQP